MTPRTQRILKAIEREERKRATREAKPERAVRRHYGRRRIRWDRPLPHEVRV